MTVKQAITCIVNRTFDLQQTKEKSKCVATRVVLLTMHVPRRATNTKLGEVKMRLGNPILVSTTLYQFSLSLNEGLAHV